MKYSLPPMRTLLCSSLSMPPTVIVGSLPAFLRMSDTMDVVVVLPWVPETAMEFGYSASSIPSA